MKDVIRGKVIFQKKATDTLNFPKRPHSTTTSTRSSVQGSRNTKNQTITITLPNSGNTGDRVSSRSPQGASVGNHLKTTSESYRKLNSNYVRHPGQRADFGTYDLFRFQVEGNQYNPHVYYRHPLPKSRTNLPGFAQKVVFEDELPLITRIPHRFRDF